MTSILAIQCCWGLWSCDVWTSGIPQDEKIAPQATRAPSTVMVLIVLAAPPAREMLPVQCSAIVRYGAVRSCAGIVPAWGAAAVNRPGALPKAAHSRDGGRVGPGRLAMLRTSPLEGVPAEGSHPDRCDRQGGLRRAPSRPPVGPRGPARDAPRREAAAAGAVATRVAARRG